MNKPGEKYQVEGGQGEAEEERHESKGKSTEENKGCENEHQGTPKQAGWETKQNVDRQKRKIGKLQRRRDKKNEVKEG